MDVAKVLVTFENKLLRWIDRAAHAAGLSRSGYLAGLVERERAELKGPGATPESRRALAEMDRLFAANDTPGEDSTALVRAMRDSR